jgi:hypothetical protein
MFSPTFKSTHKEIADIFHGFDAIVQAMDKWIEYIAIVLWIIRKWVFQNVQMDEKENRQRERKNE